MPARPPPRAVYADGGICLDILQNQWSPIYDVSAILTSIQSLLSDPNPNSPANSEARAGGRCCRACCAMPAAHHLVCYAPVPLLLLPPPMTAPACRVARPARTQATRPCC